MATSYASYDGISTIINPQNGHPYTHNERGEIFPHAHPNFRQLPVEEQARLLPLNIREELGKWAAEQQKRMQNASSVSQANPIAPNQVPKADKVARKILPASKSTHTFKYKTLAINLTSAFGKKNGEGVRRPVVISTNHWDQIEKFIAHYLDLSTKNMNNISEICKVGFSHEYDHLGRPFSLFIVYCVKNGVLERLSQKVAIKDLKTLQSLGQIYPKLFITPSKSLDQKWAQLTPDLLNRDLANVKMRTTTPMDVHAALQFSHQEAIEQAQKKAQNHHVLYAYVERPQVKDHLTSTSETLIATPLESSRTQITTRADSLQSNDVRIYHGCKVRSGLSAKDLEKSNMLLLAENYPLHFVVNASLGHLDHDQAPQTAHFQDALIQTQSIATFKWFSKKQTIVTCADDIYDYAWDNLSREDAYHVLFNLMLNSQQRYLKIQEHFTSSEKIKVREPIDAQDLTYAAVAAQFFIPMLAQLLVGSFRLSLIFEYPFVNDEAKVGLRTVFERVQEFFKQEILSSQISGEPVKTHDLIEHFITAFDVAQETNYDTEFESATED